MFIIESYRQYRWFPIWYSHDGADAAKYLKQLAEHPGSEGRAILQYRMIFDPKCTREPSDFSTPRVETAGGISTPLPFNA